MFSSDLCKVDEDDEFSTEVIAKKNFEKKSSTKKSVFCVLPNDLILTIISFYFFRFSIPVFSLRLTTKKNDPFNHAIKTLYGYFSNFRNSKNREVFVVFRSIELLKKKIIDFIPWKRVESLRFNYLSVPFIQSSYLKNMKVITNIENFEINRSGLKELSRKKYLETLSKVWIKGGFDDECVEILNKMKLLHTLRIECYGNNTSKKELVLYQLRRISFTSACCCINDFEKFKNLTHLCFQLITISSKQFDSLSKLSSLLCLKFYHCTFESCISNILKSNSLEELYFHNSKFDLEPNNLDEKDLEENISLKKFSILSYQPTSGLLRLLLKKCKVIKRINVSFYLENDFTKNERKIINIVKYRAIYK